ncbi:hypothetical protein NFI96_023086 [Prochilodus magdalenae]|nr:hypothetical protein NFI96_023086 [Prochilodus magdalenae]
MACSSFLLLLLVAHGVSAHRERHYVYHVHSLHFNSLLNSSLRYMEQTAAVLFDGKQINYYSGGKNMASARMERTWRRKTSITPERQLLQNEFEGFHNLLEISSHVVV